MCVTFPDNKRSRCGLFDVEIRRRRSVMQASFNTLDPPGSGFHYFFTVLVGMFRQDFGFTFNIVRQDFTLPMNLLIQAFTIVLHFDVFFQYFLVEIT